jgi:hypothetical protein
MPRSPITPLLFPLPAHPPRETPQLVRAESTIVD